MAIVWNIHTQTNTHRAIVQAYMFVWHRWHNFRLYVLCTVNVRVWRLCRATELTFITKIKRCKFFPVPIFTVYGYLRSIFSSFFIRSHFQQNQTTENYCCDHDIPVAKRMHAVELQPNHRTALWTTFVVRVHFISTTKHHSKPKRSKESGRGEWMTRNSKICENV